MSCAHSFGEWCQECIDGMVQQFNETRRQLTAAEAELLSAKDALCTTSMRLEAAEARVQTLEAEQALYDNAQCITCRKHLDIVGESEQYKTYTGQLHAKLTAAEANRQAWLKVSARLTEVEAALRKVGEALRYDNVTRKYVITDVAWFSQSYTSKSPKEFIAAVLAASQETPK